MHMIAIGWLWVVFMMAITEKNAVAGVMTFIFYGLVPCAVLLYLMNKHAGKRRRYLAGEREKEAAAQATGTDAAATVNGTAAADAATDAPVKEGAARDT